jgi:hypothetical protein
MEVDSWGLTQYGTCFRVNECSTNPFPCQQTFDKWVPRLPLDYISGHADKNGFGYSRVEVGSNTSTITLRVVGGNEKGSLESETVKYGHAMGAGPEKDCAGEGQEQL